MSDFIHAPQSEATVVKIIGGNNDGSNDMEQVAKYENVEAKLHPEVRINSLKTAMKELKDAYRRQEILLEGVRWERDFYQKKLEIMNEAADALVGEVIELRAEKGDE